MNIITATRAALGNISQVEFGQWLAMQTGRDMPYSRQQVNGWETGNRSPRREVRAACAKTAAAWLINQDAETIANVISQ